MKTQWEYRSIKFDLPGLMIPKFDAGRFDEQLRKLGLEGWELVNFIDLNVGAGSSFALVAVFKRQF